MSHNRKQNIASLFLYECAELFPVDPVLQIIEATCQIGKVAFLTGLHGVNILGAFSGLESDLYRSAWVFTSLFIF